MPAELTPTQFAEELFNFAGEPTVLGGGEAGGCQSWRGLISPKRKCGGSDEVPSRSGRSRSRV
jgi:hypothetical protein